MNWLVPAVRYGLPAGLFLAGVILLAADPGGKGAEGFGLFGGAAVSIALLNVLFRLGASGDRDREAEERARDYFREHGRWPDEEE
jgi:hypothetical protein